MRRTVMFKRYRWMGVLAVWSMVSIGFGTSLSAEEPSTMSLGYSMTVPDNWLTLSREEIKANPDLFENFALENANPELVEAIRERIMSGQADFYFRNAEEPSDMADNINVIKQIQALPETQEELDGQCAMLDQQLSEAFGRQVNVHQCKFSSLAGKQALYLDMDGVIPNTRTVQYQVARTKNVSLIISLTMQESRMAVVKAEFDKMMATFKIE